MLTGEMQHVDLIIKPVEPEMLLTAITAYFAIGNMQCPHCASYVHNGLIQMKGVLKVDVFFRQGIAAVTYNPAQAVSDHLIQAVSKAGQSIYRCFWAELIGQQPALQALHLHPDEILSPDMSVESDCDVSCPA